ncbi:septal ring lytic transglycosylase RlpA family protein [Sandaracinomonas limnophila]|uniref:Probable endolytic peptidoglycan transglycosylase RlpA n=1 Tax=Sandaracinomonas limnophila TaxID=1862386 RepID=A0A437PX03_9BACT|nr:septal ring lytic transglycosylase RlpA family protein [Sandaracinomonas limnophila]RVU26797.1 septal ring lytic transglycosylase RlpA family protein [Sandaracinomonas limnophila]
MKKNFTVYFLSIFPILCLLFALLEPNQVRSQKLGDEDIGIASFYSKSFYHKKTANNESLKKKELTAAHKYLPFNCLIEVTNLKNKRSIIVRINDRGPYRRGRIVDLTEIGAKKLGLKKEGLTRVRIKIVGFEKELMLIPYDHIVMDSPPKFSRKFYQKTKLRFKKKYRLKKRIRHKKYF